MSRNIHTSLYEIQCENGEIDEDSCQYEPVDCDGYYMIEQYKYDNNFPKEWALSHLPGTGPEQCGNCYDYGSKDGLFVGYCANCAVYDYNCERGPGMGLDDDESFGNEQEDQDNKKEIELDSNTESEPVETNAERLAKLIELSKDLDYVFDIANGKAPSDDHVAMEFFGIKEE